MSFRKIATGLVVILLLVSFTNAASQDTRTGFGDVWIHLNGGDDVAYIGETNIIEIWIENDALLDGLSLGFEFDIGRDFQFNATYGAYGQVNPEGRVIGAFNLFSGINAYFDGVNPDSVLIGGASFPPFGLPAGGPDVCYTLAFDVLPNQEELVGGVCIDNVVVLPSGTWLFHDVGGSYPPLYQGNPNSSGSDPDAPAVCFDIVQRTYNPPVIENCPTEIYGDHCNLTTYQFVADDPDPGDQLSWSVIQGPGSIETNTGLYSVFGLEPGGYDVTVEVMDLWGNYDQCPFLLVMTNNPPFFIDPCEDQMVDFDEILEYQIIAADPDPCDPLTYSIVGVTPTPDGPMAIDGAGLFIFEPTELDIGVDYSIDIEVGDGWEFIYCNFVVTVLGPELYDIGFKQYDWYDTDGSLVQLNSIWGRFEWKYITDDSATYYVNLTMSNGGPFQWMIRNLPLFPTLPTGERFEAGFINLEDIGISNGVEVNDVSYVVSVTPVPLAVMPVAPIQVGTFLSEDWRAWDLHFAGEPPLAPPPAPVPVEIPDDATQIGSDRDVGAVQEEDNCCMAGSIARSLDWLNRTHGLGNDETAAEIYERLKEYGVSGPEAYDNVTDRIEAKTILTDLELGGGVVTKVWDRGGGFVDPIPGVTESTEGLIEWLKREIKTEDIELDYQWWDPVDGVWKAHIVTVVDVYEGSDGSIYIKYRDDNPQGDDDAGDDAVQHAKLEPHGDGWFGLGSTGNFILFGLSESVRGTAILGNTGDVTVRNTLTLHQGSFRNPQFANDLHFTIWTDSDIDGCDINVIGFGQVDAAANGARAVDVDCSMGQVPYCTNLKIDIALYLTSWNEKRLRDIRWTREGREEAKACPDFGWMIEPPVEVVPGQYLHRVHLYNDDLTDPIMFNSIEFLPSNSYVGDLTTLSGYTVSLPTTMLSPQSSYVYDLIEYDALSSHIYGHFEVLDEMENQLVEDWFDHPTTSYVAGDADGNSIVNISDAVYLISYIFGGGPAPEPLTAGDADCNAIVNISDAVYLISYIFGGGPEPCDCPPGSTREGPFCVTNDTGSDKQSVTIILAGTGGTLSDPKVTVKPEGCGEPTVTAEMNRVTITFDTACVPDGEEVCFTVCSMHSPIVVAGYEWE